MSVLRATYEDGFVLIEDEHDESPYDEGRNVFHAIANARPVRRAWRLLEFALMLRAIARRRLDASARRRETDS
jgi:hypothetical protein